MIRGKVLAGSIWSDFNADAFDRAVGPRVAGEGRRGLESRIYCEAATVTAPAVERLATSIRYPSRETNKESVKAERACVVLRGVRAGALGLLSSHRYES